MFDVMSQAKNAMESYSTKLKAITANITNMSVQGYKRTDISFEDVFSKLISEGQPANMMNGEGGTNPTQYGGTAAISSASIDFTGGGTTTGSKSDMFLKDSTKLFIVSPDGGPTKYYTRAGAFDFIDNKLVTKRGYQVYGFRSGSSSLSPIDLTGIKYSSTENLTWDENGNLIDVYPDPADPEASLTTVLPFRIAVTSFQNLSGLRYVDGTNFEETISSGSPLSPTDPGTGGVSPKLVEASNVVYTSEVVDSMEIQRALDAALTVIKMANDTITAFINKLS
jgi:flagellar hook protein FlgE